ncbi:MAG TPA: ACT domain-containing protein, partial [Xanthobacteraceae bacterium]|nr:ACT domain-containing protein [Xanthobacteraceae bacterium]
TPSGSRPGDNGKAQLYQFFSIRMTCGFPNTTLSRSTAASALRTASSVVSDIGDIARGVRTAPFGRPTGRLTVSKKAPMQRHEGGYYIRLLAVDKPGTAATIAKRLAQQNISLESIVQRHRGERPHGGDVPGRSSEPVPVILITYATTEDAVRKALAAVDRDKVVLGKPQVIRIEKN